MVSVKQETEFVKEWYSGFRLPRFDGSRDDNSYIAKLVLNSYPILHSVDVAGKAVPPWNHHERKFSVIRLVPAVSGSIHYEKFNYGSSKIGVVQIPTWYFNKNRIEDDLGVLSIEEMGLVSLLLLNGTLIHEGLHYSLSPESIQEFYTDAGNRNKWVLGTIAQVVEDNFIEGFTYGTKVEGFISGMNALYYNEARFSQNYNAIRDYSQGEQVPDIVSRILDFIYISKNRRLDSHSGWDVCSFATELTTLIRKSRKNQTFYLRRELVHQIYDLIMGFVKQENQNQNQQTNSNQGEGEGSESQGENQESEEGEGNEETNKDEEFQRELERKLEEAENNTSGNSIFEKNPEEAVETGKIEYSEKKRQVSKDEKEIAQEVNKEEKAFIASKQSRLLNAPVTITEVEEAAIHNQTSFGKAPSYIAPLVKALQNEERKSKPNAPQRRGSKIVPRNLPLAGYQDSPLLFTSYDKAIPEFPSVILLLDNSGSMNNKYGGSTLYKTALEATYHLYQAMKHKRIGVFSHTSKDVKGVENSIIYPIAASQIAYPAISRSKAKRNFESVSSMYKGANIDGFAIAQVGSYFPKGNKKRLLVVISDGTPYGRTYTHDYDLGKIHTKSKVEELRKQGITVISLSLVSDVMPSNDFIYGEGNNFLVTSSKDLAERVMGAIM